MAELYELGRIPRIPTMTPQTSQRDQHDLSTYYMYIYMHCMDIQGCPIMWG